MTLEMVLLSAAITSCTFVAQLEDLLTIKPSVEPAQMDFSASTTQMETTSGLDSLLQTDSNNSSVCRSMQVARSCTLSDGPDNRLMGSRGKVIKTLWWSSSTPMATGFGL